MASLDEAIGNLSIQNCRESTNRSNNGSGGSCSCDSCDQYSHCTTYQNILGNLNNNNQLLNRHEIAETLFDDVSGFVSTKQDDLGGPDPLQHATGKTGATMRLALSNTLNAKYNKVNSDRTDNQIAWEIFKSFRAKANGKLKRIGDQNMTVACRRRVES